MATFAVSSWLNDTTIVSAGTSQGFTYSNPTAVRGPVDSVFAGYSASVGDSVTIIGHNYGFNVPSDATITSFRAYYASPESAGTHTISIRTMTTPATAIYSGSATRNAWYELPLTGVTPALLNDLRVQVTLSGSGSRRRVDALGIGFDYTTPDPVGPQTKVLRNGVWTVVPMKRFNGTTWTNAIIKKI